MAGTPYLVDSNVLPRWVKPDDRHPPPWLMAIAGNKVAGDPLNVSPAQPIAYLSEGSARIVMVSSTALVGEPNSISTTYDGNQVRH
jgi:hypothetical protein